jgi:hypothetical protein
LVVMEPPPGLVHPDTIPHCYSGVSRILLTLNGESLARVFLSGNRVV